MYLFQSNNTEPMLLTAFSQAIFLCFTSLCDADEPELEKEVSKLLMPKRKSLFARSFDALPANRPIRPCQFRTGKRFIHADNFQSETDFDRYLGKHGSGKVCKADSFSLASDSALEFQMLCADFLRMFQRADEWILDRLGEHYHNEVSYLQSKKPLCVEQVQEFFFFNGECDSEALTDLADCLRCVSEQRQQALNLEAHERPFMDDKSSRESSVSSEDLSEVVLEKIPNHPIPLMKNAPKPFFSATPCALS